MELRLRQLAVRALGLAAALAVNGGAAAASPHYVLSNNTPGFIKKAADQGAVDPATQITVTAWLNLHNENQLLQLLQSQRQKGAKNYHAWLTQDQFNAQFSPTSQEVKAVQNFLTAHGLTVVTVAENNFYVKVQGSVGNVEKAFHVQIDSFLLDGATYRANTGNPSINDVSGGHVAAVTGLDDFGYAPMLRSASAADGSVAAGRKVTSSPNGLFFEGQCFDQTGLQTMTFTSGTTSATYAGNRYGADISNTTLGLLPPCGYQPAEIQTAYDLNPLYTQGLDGSGQTIVITDAYGSDSIADEAALFSQVYGLPPVDLTVLRAPGAVNNGGPADRAAGWAAEISLDVEWSHALAPGAKIVLVVGPNNRSDLDEAINYAVVHHLGNTISNSWGSIEGFGNPAQFDRVNRILMSAAAQGIDVNFSTGDDGDVAALAGFPTVGFPASSPYATGVGGTSLFLNPDNTIAFQTGWGNNLARIADTVAAGSPPADPPLFLGFQGGAGGGASLTFTQPSWQAGLPGTTRQTPDIAMLADPFTGGEFIFFDPTQNGFFVGVIGGTSLACPMFSAIMAIAAQKAGHGLGQAAPLLYTLPAGSVTDVTDTTTPNNVSGSITDAGGTTVYSADALAAPLGNTTNYVSALYNSPFSTRWFVLTFGTDSSLTTATGWDNVTGLGTPDAANFVLAITQ